MRQTSLVLGGDLGGTSTRIVVADTAGRVVGRGTAGGSNPVSHPETAAAALSTALDAALRGLDPAQVEVAVIGAAGGVALARPEVAGQFKAAWSGTGLLGAPTYIGDVEVAFASATTAPDGTALIAGTGAGAAELRDHRVVRTADANGWLLGDDGSGFWLGREAARATLRALDELAPLGPLGEAVIAELLGGRPEGVPPETEWNGARELRDQLIRSANSRPPVMLAELARTVSAGYDAGDPAAVEIAERAAELLIGTINRIRPVDSTGPLVLAGSVAGESSPVGRLLRERLKDVPGQVLTARNGVGGAAWLALRTLDPALATPEAHASLTTPS
jgi:N-acetylglucosamine kinase-like BadF-type ATPase